MGAFNNILLALVLIKECISDAVPRLIEFPTVALHHSIGDVACEIGKQETSSVALIDFRILSVFPHSEK